MTTAQLYEIYLRHPSIQTDTRQLKQDDLFFALKGPNFNGNKFAAKALEMGAAYAVIDEPLSEDELPPPYAMDRLIHVKDVLKALQDLAGWHRKQFNIPFIAITGSNGKTTTKELIHAVLSSTFITYTTKGNLNNHIGIPLTILSVKSDAEFAVIEMGANHQKEIEGYCTYTLPTHGIITNIGKAHLEGFGGPEGVKKGKGELYDYLRDNNGSAFVFKDSADLKQMSRGIAHVITYGTADADFTGGVDAGAGTGTAAASAATGGSGAHGVSGGAGTGAAVASAKTGGSGAHGVSAVAAVANAATGGSGAHGVSAGGAVTGSGSHGMEGSGSHGSGGAAHRGSFLNVRIEHGASTGTIHTQLVGDYNLPNILVAVAVGKHFGVDDSKILQSIENYAPSNSRSQLIEKESNHIILDAYNANPSSMRAAIENFARLPDAGFDKKVLILGAMAELGEESVAEHQGIVDLIAQYPWKQVVLVGGDFLKIKHPWLSFKNSADAAVWFRGADIKDSYLLVKGSRSSKMEVVLA